jgi:hypothetical protein
MSEFLTTHGVAHHIEEIIRTAEHWLFLVSPFLQLSQPLYQRLQDADRRGVRTVIVYGKSELKAEETKRLQALKNLSVYYCANLHAKCYFNQNCMVISSMNMYEFSEKNNREMGILFRTTADADVARVALDEVLSILAASERKWGAEYDPTWLRLDAAGTAVTAAPDWPRPSVQTSPAREHPGASSPVLHRTRIPHRPTAGYCIRCGEMVGHDVDYPLCDECYPEWAVYRNLEYVERFCHTCGGRSRTSYARPECSECYFG